MTSDDLVTSRYSAEEDRIRAAYDARRDSWRYSWLNPGHVYIRQEQHRAVLDALRTGGYHSLESIQLLDVGCGTGHWLRQFVDWGASPHNLMGIDLIDDRVETARRLCPPGVRLLLGNGAAVNVPDEHFDVVLLFTTFTSILHADLRKAVAAETVRVVKRQGLIVWYDFCVGNPANGDVRAVRRLDIEALFPTCSIQLRRITLAPPLVRLFAPRAHWVCSVLNVIPVLRTHYFGVIRRR